jgi:hypothetical protein
VLRPIPRDVDDPRRKSAAATMSEMTTVMPVATTSAQRGASAVAWLIGGHLPSSHVAMSSAQRTN